jgi:hypothetical protein
MAVINDNVPYMGSVAALHNYFLVRYVWSRAGGLDAGPPFHFQLPEIL